MIPPLPQETFENIVKQWSQIFRFRECAIAYIGSKDQLLWRLRQLEESIDIKNKYFSDCPFRVIDLDTEIAEDYEDVNVLFRPGTNYLVLGADKLMSESNNTLLKAIANKCLKDSISIILFFHAHFPGIIYPKIWRKGLNHVLQNQIIHPIYSQADIGHFLRYLEEKWTISLTAQSKKSIVGYSFGDMGIAKHLVRLMRDGLDFDTAVSDTSIISRLEAMWGMWSNEEKDVLQKIYTREAVPESKKRLREFLLKTGIVMKTGKKLEINHPIKHFLARKSLNASSLVVENDVIYQSGVPINKNFSKLERKMLQILLANPNTLFSREEMADRIWVQEKEYSDWSLDRLAYRLRRKLRALNISTEMVTTVKKKGYICKYD